MDEKLLAAIPHIGEISHRGVYAGAPAKHTATFQERSSRQNKVLPSLEDFLSMAVSRHMLRSRQRSLKTVW